MGMSKVQAQTAPTKAPSASLPIGQMYKGAAGSHDMKSSMMMGMDGMQKMQMSGDTDKDFAMMMKMHHQQALNMAEMELANGKSPGGCQPSWWFLPVRNSQTAVSPRAT